ncbi:MAG: NAD/FAD-binding protein, partial [Desulfobulbia bacterium]
EQQLLSPFRYSNNNAILHSDSSMMPKRRNLWSSWNYISENLQQSVSLQTTYWMNSLQFLDTTRDIFLTLNPGRTIPKAKTQYSVHYKHPIFDKKAIEAQQDLWQLQGRRRTWLCGSYFGYGFHEDGLQSGLSVAEQLGGYNRPWNVRGQYDRIKLVNQTPQPIFIEAAE